MNKLKELREAKGLKQKDIYTLMQIAKSTYSYWENGRTEPDQASLIKLAEFYGVSVDYIIGNKKTPTENIASALQKDFAGIGLTAEKYNQFSETEKADLLKVVEIYTKHKK